MKIVGLTGSIGMGKSTVAQFIREEGTPVYDADAAVHALYERGGAAVGPVGEAFPEAIVNGAVDRERLSRAVLSSPDALKTLESIVHPLVAQAQLRFVEEARAAGAPLVVLDIPLLYEKGGEKRVEKVIVVSAPPDVQRARVLARAGMTAEKFEAILAKQTPDSEKRARADFVIDTNCSFDDTRAQVRAVLVQLRDASC